MNPLFYQIPNWVDQIGVAVMATFLVGIEVLVAMIWLWIIAEIGLAIYERLSHRVFNLSV